MPTHPFSVGSTLAARSRRLAVPLIAAVMLGAVPSACAESSAQRDLKQSLSQSKFKIAYETYTNNNWEIYVMNADGSNPVNLTRTPAEQEHYPQISPDGRHLCFTVDTGEGRDTVRSLYVMDTDGGNRRKLVERAREPFWSPDGRRIGFLPQEFPKFNVIDYYTKGMSFYDLEKGSVAPHPNSEKLHHLYNPSFAPNGRWIISTVHAGMGFDHAILAIEANGSRVVNLGIPGCRPCVSPDGRQIAWGSGDHEVVAAPIDFAGETPKVGSWRLRIRDKTNATYHVDWSPDSQFLSLSRGPESHGDPTKPGTFQSACEIVGVYAPGWNLLAVPASRDGILNLDQPGEKDIAILTTNGLSNKESAWFDPSPRSKK